MKSIHIKSIENLSLEEFQKEYQSKGIPILIKGGILESKASNWTFDSLKQSCGNKIVQVRKNVDKETYKVGLKYAIEALKVGDYIDLIFKNPEKAKKYYMAVQNVSTSFPEISKDVNLPKYIQKKHMGPYLWVGSPSHYEFCHFDADDGFLMMIQGKKKVKLFKDLMNLYPNKLGCLGRTIQSQVDCDILDVEKFPKLKDTVCEEGILEPGDALFIPAFYWHQVTSLTESISLNCFFGDDGESKFLTKILDQRFDSFMYWILNIIEQNIEYESFHNIYHQLDKAIQQFIFKQWHEKTNDKQIEKITIEIKDYLKKRNYKPKNIEKLSLPKLKIRGLLFRNEDKI